MSILVTSALAIGQELTCPRREVVEGELVKSIGRIHRIECLTVLNDEEASTGNEKQWVRHRLAIAGPERFLLETWHATTRVPWEEDYDHVRSIILEKAYVVDKPMKRVFLKRSLRAGELPERFAIQPFFAASGWWPEESSMPCPVIPGSKTSLLDLIRDPKYTVLQKEEEVFDSSCVVVDCPGLERLWLDPNKGMAVRRRTWMDPGSSNERLSLEVEDLVSVAPGLWLPLKCRIFVAAKNGVMQ